MRHLQAHHITDVYCMVDDLVFEPLKPKGGRPPALSQSEVVTILIWNVLTVRQPTLKDLYAWIDRYHRLDFPTLPPYNRFVDHCHRSLPVLLMLLQQTLANDAPLKFVDSTMLEVCRLVRADRHKVCKNIANFGKNHQGWHYGFKLHASINAKRQLCGMLLSPANMHDAQAMPFILNHHTKIAVGDSAYGARVMGRHLFETYGTIVLAPPHYTQKRKILTSWQHKLLMLRPKIESVFGYLKQQLHLVTSFPRSIHGYLLHYIRILLGYQFLVG